MTTGFNFYIDDVLVYTSPLTVATPMYPAFSDFYTSTPLTVDWARVTPYASPCTFTSRVFGSSTPSDWADIVWTSTEPAGTAITMRVRTGETVVPDGSWSAWQSITNGAAVGVTSRYIQYEATLSTTDPFVTPVLKLVARRVQRRVGCHAAVDHLAFAGAVRDQRTCWHVGCDRL
ncbi:MAG: hypothetical protein HND48_03610 [Chloroflexi bacterium]|nr:hypothetical protein [Chloroflexota bacterium]